MGRRFDASPFCTCCCQSAPRGGGRRFTKTAVRCSHACCSNGNVSNVLSIIVPALKLVGLGSISAVIALRLHGLRLHGKREFAVGLSQREKSGPSEPDRAGLGLVTRAATLVLSGGAGSGSMSCVLACQASWLLATASRALSIIVWIAWLGNPSCMSMLAKASAACQRSSNVPTRAWVGVSCVLACQARWLLAAASRALSISAWKTSPGNPACNSMLAKASTACRRSSNKPNEPTRAWVGERGQGAAVSSAHAVGKQPVQRRPLVSWGRPSNGLAMALPHNAKASKAWAKTLSPNNCKISNK